MAEVNEHDATDVDNRISKTTVDESAIPGASLLGRKPELLTVAELKQWLRCRKGASLKGRKKELCDRVKMYIANGWDKKYLHHPDKDISKAGPHSEDQFASYLLDFPPPSGFTNCLESVPMIEDSDIYQYFLVKCDNIQSTARKHRDTGWNFYMSGKVTLVEFNMQSDDNLMLIRSNVSASFDRACVTGKTKKKYDIYIVLDKFTAAIQCAKCLCKAGAGGFCKHVAATLFCVLDNQRAGNKFVTQLGSKTSQLQTWNKPKVVGTACIEFSELDFVAYNYESDIGGKSNIKRKYEEYNPCKSDGTVSKESVEQLCDSLKATGQCHLLVDLLESNNCEPVQKCVKSDKEADSCQVKDLNSDSFSSSSITDLSFTLTDAQHAFYSKHVIIRNAEEARQLSQKTSGQSTSKAWYDARKVRITASNFKEVVNRKKMPCEKLLQKLIGSTSFKSPHTTWGKQAEPVALVQYKAEMSRQGFDVKLQATGLVVNPTYPHLGASPDGIVELKKDGRHNVGLVEVKSLSKYALLTPLEASVLPDSFFTMEGGSMKLKENHKYFYQIQGQIHICGLDWCDLIVWSPRGYELQRIYKDTVLWADILANLSMFYFNHMLPALCANSDQNKEN